MTDEVFAALSSEQMGILKDADILQYIITNKQKQVSNTTEQFQTTSSIHLFNEIVY